MNVIHRSPPPDRFFTTRLESPIPVRGPLSAELLIQASLDPRVRAIGFIETLALGSREVRIGAPVVQRDEGEFVLLLAGGNPEREPDAVLVEKAIDAHAMSAEWLGVDDVAREPLATTARVIWRQRFVHVDLSMRLALSGVFENQASMTLDELCSRVQGTRDPVFAVMALLCEGGLRADLSQGFDRTTKIWGPR